ncbi:MAG: hypothetical protein LBE80_08860 [Deltaproteobacteria bacterium]|nr:hypothetical protein [Deltaproteobacteria bacterium]
MALKLVQEDEPDNYPATKELANLPEPYRSIGQKLAKVRKSSRPVKPTNQPEMLTQKIQKLFLTIPEAKTVSPCNTLIKCCQELEGYLAKSPNLKIVKAITNIAQLMRQLKIKSRRNYDFSKTSAIYNHSSFKELSNLPSNPILLAFWNLFCSMGQEKYGDHWGNQARLLALNFMPDLDQNLSTFFQGYLSLDTGQKSGFRQMAEMLFSMMGNFGEIDEMPKLASIEYFIKSGRWISQELYFLVLVWIHEVIDKNDVSLEQYKQDKLISCFSKLTVLGKKIRHGFTFWTSEIIEEFEEAIKTVFSIKSLQSLSRAELPFNQFSLALSLTIFFYNPSLRPQLANLRRLSADQPGLTDQQISEAGRLMFAQQASLAPYWPNLSQLLNPEDISRFYEDWLKRMLESSIKEAIIKNIDNSPYLFARFSPDNNKFTYAKSTTWQHFDMLSLYFGLANGPKSGLIKAFLEILLPPKYKSFPNSITQDSQKLESFFKEATKASAKLTTEILILATHFFDFHQSFFEKLTDIILNKLIVEDDFSYLLLGIYCSQRQGSISHLLDYISKKLSQIPAKKTSRYIKKTIKTIEDLQSASYYQKSDILQTLLVDWLHSDI